MLAPRGGLYSFNSSESLSSPPPYQTALDRHPSFLLTYWCSSCAVVLILVRVVGRFVRTNQLYRDDKLMLLSIIPLAIRLGFAHVVLKYGTNNVDAANLSSAELRRRTIGSGMVLGARVFYAMFIWAQKFCTTEFYERLIEHLWEANPERRLKWIRWSLLFTFVAAVATIFAECHPTYKLWQVYPDPGPRCRQSLVPLISMGALNILTDLALIIWPLPTIWRSHFTASKKVQLTLTTFSLSSLCIAITLVRIPSIIQQHADQTYRTLWASADILVATAVSNAVVIKGFARDRGRKKTKFRMTPEDVMERRRRIESTASKERGIASQGGYCARIDSGFEEEKVKRPQTAIVKEAKGKETGRNSARWDSMKLEDPGGLLRIEKDLDIV